MVIKIVKDNKMTIKITIADALTDEVIEREMNEKELAQYEADTLKREAREKVKAKAETDKAAVKASAQAKLAALGLTPDEVTAIIGA